MYRPKWTALWPDLMLLTSSSCFAKPVHRVLPPVHWVLPPVHCVLPAVHRVLPKWKYFQGFHYLAGRGGRPELSGERPEDSLLGILQLESIFKTNTFIPDVERRWGGGWILCGGATPTGETGLLSLQLTITLKNIEEIIHDMVCFLLKIFCSSYLSSSPTSSSSANWLLTAQIDTWYGPGGTSVYKMNQISTNTVKRMGCDRGCLSVTVFLPWPGVARGPWLNWDTVSMSRPHSLGTAW